MIYPLSPGGSLHLKNLVIITLCIPWNFRENLSHFLKYASNRYYQLKLIIYEDYKSQLTTID